MDGKFPEGGGAGQMRPVAKRDNSCTLNFLLQVIPVGKFEKPLNLSYAIIFVFQFVFVDFH